MVEQSKGQGLCWQSNDGGLNGTYCAMEDAKLLVLDGGFCQGINLYDYASMWQGWIRKLDAHVNRFYRNMHACKMDPEISRGKFTEQVLETVRRSGLKDAGISFVVTWGPYPAAYAKRGEKLGGPDHKVGLQVWVRPYRWIFPPECIEEGTKVIIPSIRAYPNQCLNPRLKNFDRLHFFLAQLEAVNAGADGFITLTIDGHLAEGFNANVWLIKQGKLFTPSESTLAGITSDCIYDLAREMNIEAAATFLTAWDLYTADEAFFCTSAGGITPIIEVDSRTVGDGKPGFMTKRLIEAYWKMHVNPKYAVQVY